MAKVTLEQLLEYCRQGDPHAMYAYSQYLFGQGKLNEALEQLRKATEKGHLEAAISLAKLLLHDNSCADLQAAKVILDAPDLSSEARALMLRAQLALRTEAQEHRAEKSLHYLNAAADLGEPSAKSACDLLRQLGSPHTDNAATLLLPNWFEWHGEPVQSIPVPLPKILCQHIIDSYRNRVRPSMVVDPVTGQPKRDEIRRSSSASIDLMDLDFVTYALIVDVANSLGVEVAHCENLALLHYRENEEYRYHADYLINNSGQTSRSLTLSGQRTHTVLIYLNEGYQGGETDFPKWQLKALPALGKAIMFKNIDEYGQPDRDSIHAGKPVLAGEKWVLSIWVREKPYQHVW